MGLRLALADDHPAILHAVVDAIRADLDVAEVVTVRHVSLLLDDSRDFDLTVLDLQLGDGSDPADNVRAVAERGWPVLLYTQEMNPAVVARCFAAGAMGIVSKSEELATLVDAVRIVIGGQPYLSGDWASALKSQTIPNLAPREQEALRLFAAGLPMKLVARRMGISQETVKEYLMRTRRRYQEAGRPVASRTDLYIRAVEDGLIPPPTS